MAKKDDGQSSGSGGEQPLHDWLRERMRLGRGDDTVIIFIPSHERDGKTEVKDQDVWASQGLELMGKLFGGATGFPNLRGIWRDDEQGGRMLEDRPIMIQSLAKRADVENVGKV